MTAYADDLAIHGGPIGEDIVYEQMTTALKKIKAEAMQLGLKFSPEKCEALWYRCVDPDWHFKIAGARIPWRPSVKYLGGHHRQEAKLQETSRLRKTKDGHQDECT